MEAWHWWVMVGAVMVALEVFLPGGIVVFLGLAALFVGGSVYFGLINTVYMAFIVWFISSLVSLILLRTIFIRYFEGDSSIENVDEDKDLVGSMVEVVEEIKPYKLGRVRLHDSSWDARSDDELVKGAQARVIARDGNQLIVKPI